MAWPSPITVILFFTSTVETCETHTLECVRYAANTASLPGASDGCALRIPHPRAGEASHTPVQRLKPRRISGRTPAPGRRSAEAGAGRAGGGAGWGCALRVDVNGPIARSPGGLRPWKVLRPSPGAAQGEGPSCSRGDGRTPFPPTANRLVETDASGRPAPAAAFRCPGNVAVTLDIDTQFHPATGSE